MLKDLIYDIDSKYYGEEDENTNYEKGIINSFNDLYLDVEEDIDGIDEEYEEDDYLF